MYTWYLAYAYALYEGDLTEEKLKPYKKSFKQSKRFKNYMAGNADHNTVVKEIVTQIKFGDAYIAQIRKRDQKET